MKNRQKYSFGRQKIQTASTKPIEPKIFEAAGVGLMNRSPKIVLFGKFD
jgi:hypothetical protein